MKSIYEQFKEGTLQAGQRVTFTGTVEEIDDSDTSFPVLVNIEGNGKMWLREGTIKYMEPAPEKLYEVCIGDHLEAVAIAQEVTKEPSNGNLL